MKLRHYLQTMAFCVVGLGVSLASANDVSYSNADQRLRDLEQRLASLEANSDSVNLASYSGGCGDGCGNGCGDGCGSCGSSVGYGSGCGGCCSTKQFDAELLLFAVNNSEPDRNGTQDELNAGFRLTYTSVNSQNRIFRVRYSNFGSSLEGNNNRIEFEKIDTEIGRRFCLGGLNGEFTAGIRWASFEERGENVYDSTFGPLLGVQLRGREILRGTSFVSLRHSWQFGDEGPNDVPGTFTISEVMLGLEWTRCTCMGNTVIRTGFEAQHWSGLQNNDSQDIGLIGWTNSVGVAF